MYVEEVVCAFAICFHSGDKYREDHLLGMQADV